MAERAASILMKSLEDRWASYQKARRRTQSSMSEKNVHDLRVALRRLEATVSLAGLFLPETSTQRTRRRLKRLRKRLNPLRDAQVQILAVRDMIPDYPDLRKFQRKLKRREKSLLRPLRKEIRLGHGRLKKSFAGMLDHSANRLRMFTGDEIQRTITAGAEKAYASLIDVKRRVDPQDAPSIHRMRVAFKKFRYVIESAPAAFEGVTEATLQNMNRFQGMLGDIQDAEVLFESVMQWGRSRRRRMRRRLAPVYTAIAQRRRDAIDGFLARINDVHTFWIPQTQKSSLAPIRAAG